jgi:hypothetical protein
MSKRFPIRIDGWWGPLLLPFGATNKNSAVEVMDEAVHFHFGFFFDRAVPRSEIEDVYRRTWPWWMGVGWKSNFRGVIGLIGSYDGVVEMKLRTKTRAWGAFPCDRIAVSLRDPDGFITAVGGPTAEPAVQPPRSAPAQQRAASTRARKTTARRNPTDTKRTSRKRS